METARRRAEAKLQKGGLWNQQRPKRKQDRFTLLTKTPKEILALDKGKFKPPPPMTTSVEKRNASKFCKFHREVRHTTYECMHLKRQIEEMLKAKKLSHPIKELKQSSGKDKSKDAKKGEISGKDKPLAILMDDTEGPMIIEAEIGGYFVYRMYVDEGSFLEILYENYFNKFCPEVRSQMIPATTPLVGFSEEIIWKLGKISLLVKIGDEEHSTSAWMNFMIVRSPSPYNRIIGRPGSLVALDLGSTRFKQLMLLPLNVVTTAKLAVKPSHGKKTRRQLEDVRGFQGPKQSMPQRWLSAVENRLKEAEIAFKQMKKLIAELPMLTAPKEKKELIMYLAAATEAISAVLMTERDRKQMPIYFASRALHGPEVNYTPMEKLILALVSASKRLKRYLQAHTIVVIIDQPIKQMLPNPEVIGILLKWRFDLDEHDIHYRPRTSVKGQILADFIVERPEDDHLDTLMDDKEELPDPWILFMNGSSCMDGSEAGLIITNPKGMELTYALRFMFNATNNEVEYEALIAGLRIAKQMGEKSMDEKEVLTIVEEEGRTWMTLIYEYLAEEILPEEKRKARAIRHKAALGVNLDLLEEKREQTAIQEARSNAKMEKYYNARVRSTSFRPRDLIYRNNEVSHAKDGGKLGPKWEGLYEVTEALGK
uniref:Reverse transcriptase domain-containing protein n=1 Tax=Tanacetum cinerariifolium TaxID=118510 RepID=A0A6L2NBN9_TANCI|nr:reverse transcriptase domain-containing protein [Tanacetum cinerariifolium]